jgi:HEAT repeat protein
MRRTVAQELGQIGDPAAKDALKAALTDADEGTRLEAASALALLGDASGRDAALAGLQSADPTARRRAALALARGGDAPALSALDAAYAGEKDPATRSTLKDARSIMRKRLGLPNAGTPAAGR